MRAFFLALFCLCRKELLAVLKDPGSRVILLMPSLVQTVLFGYAATYDLNQANYALLDQSHGAAASAFIAKVEGNGIFHRVATLQSQQDIGRVIDSQAALFVLQIGPRFEQQLTAGEGAPVQLILDARNSNTAGTASAYLGVVVEAFNEEWRAGHDGAAPGLQIVSRAWYNPNLETRWNILPGLIAALSMLQTLMLSALSVAREREQGTFDQLLVTPLSPTQILIGKAIPPILIGLAQSSIVLLVALFWFKVPLAGSPFALYTGLLLFTIASVGVGLSISALSANMQQAMLYTFVLLMPMVLLSGLSTPIRNMPPSMQMLTRVNPLRYAIDLVQRVYLEGVGLDAVLGDIWPLLLMALVTLPLAAWLFRKRLV
ncbi:ABC-2 type transport system permease protein [Oxalobacteraceae bacterium GrIS 1.11]